MRNVTYLDSAGIGMLVSKYLTTLRRSGGLALLHLTVRSDQLMHVTQLHSVLKVFDSEDEAVRSLGLEPVVPRDAPR